MGIGRTRLATEFLVWAEIEEVDVLWEQAFETGGLLPYRPVIDVFLRGTTYFLGAVRAVPRNLGALNADWSWNLAWCGSAS